MVIKRIDYELCSSCLHCYTICPMNVIQKIGRLPYIAYESDCMSCFLCEIECKKSAIYIDPERAWKKVLVYE